VLPGEHKKPAVTPPALPTATTKTPPVAKPTPTAKPTANVKLPPPTAAEPTTLRAANARSKSLESEIQSLQQQIIELKGRKEGTTGVPVVGAPASATPPSRPPVSGTPVAAMPASVTPASVTPTSGTPESSTGAAATPLPTPTQVAAVPGETDPAQAEIARLTTLVETLQRRLDARPPIEGLTSPIVPSDSPAHSWSTGLTLGIIGVAIGWFIGSTRGRKPDRGRRPRVRF